MMVKSKANSKTMRTDDGFSVIELVVVVTILAVVTSFGVIGIKNAKASIRLSGAASPASANSKVLTPRNGHSKWPQRGTKAQRYFL